MLIRKIQILITSLILLLFCTSIYASSNQTSDDSLTPFQRELNEIFDARMSRTTPNQHQVYLKYRLLESRRSFELALDSREFSNSLALLLSKTIRSNYNQNAGKNLKSDGSLYEDDLEFHPDFSYSEFIRNLLPEITKSAVDEAKQDIIQCMLLAANYDENGFKNLPDIVKTCHKLGRTEIGLKISETAATLARSNTRAGAVATGLIRAAECQFNLGNTQKAIELADEAIGIIDNCKGARDSLRELQKLVSHYADSGEHDKALDICSRLRFTFSNGPDLLFTSIEQLSSDAYFDLSIGAARFVHRDSRRADAILIIIDNLKQVSDTEKPEGNLETLYQIAKSITSYYERCKALSKLAVAFHENGNTELATEIILNDLGLSNPDIAETININAIYFPISALVDIGDKQTAIELIDNKLKSFHDRNFPDKVMEGNNFILASCYLRAGMMDKSKSLISTDVPTLPQRKGSYSEISIPISLRNALNTDLGIKETMVDYPSRRTEDPRLTALNLKSKKIKDLLKQNKLDEAYKIAYEIEDMYYPPEGIKILIEKLLERHEPDKAFELVKAVTIKMSGIPEAFIPTEIACEFADQGDIDKAFNIIWDSQKVKYDHVIKVLIHYANSPKFNKQKELKACENVASKILAYKHRNSLKSRNYKVDSLRMDNIPDIIPYITEAIKVDNSNDHSRRYFNKLMEIKSKERLDLIQLSPGVTIDEYLNSMYLGLVSQDDSQSKLDSLLILAKQYAYHGDTDKPREILEIAYKIALALVLNENVNRDSTFHNLTAAFAEIGCTERAREIRSLYWTDISESEFIISIAKGYVAKGQVQDAVDLLTKSGNIYVTRKNVFRLMEPLIEYGNYGTAFEMFEISVEAGKSATNTNFLYLVIRLAEKGRFDIVFKMLFAARMEEILIDTLNTIEKLRIEAGYELTEEDLFNLRKVVHNDIYFCKYPLTGSMEDTQ